MYNQCLCLGVFGSPFWDHSHPSASQQIPHSQWNPKNWTHTVCSTLKVQIFVVPTESKH